MILCRNGHPNEDGATYCAVCKVYIDSTAQAVVTAPEPPTPQTSESPLSAELVPQVSVGRVNGEHVLTLRNTGAQTAISEPAVAETDGDVNVVLDPSTIAIERGETASARVRVTPKRPLWLGRRRTHRFGLNVSPGVSVDGSMVQKARIPFWAPLALVPVVVAVVVLVFLTGGENGPSGPTRLAQNLESQTLIGGPGYEEISGITAVEGSGLRALGVGFSKPESRKFATVWMLDRAGGNWTSKAEQFGRGVLTSVAESGSNIVAVGWSGPDDPGNEGQDAAVWKLSSGTWTRACSAENGCGSVSGGGSLGQVMWDVTPWRGGFVAVGNDAVTEQCRGTEKLHYNAAVWKSSDGSNWQRVSPGDDVFGGPCDQEMMAAIATGTGLVAVGRNGLDGAVWTSPDGDQWTRVTGSFRLEEGTLRLEDVADTGSRLVAVGRQGDSKDNFNRGAVVFSDDRGQTWHVVKNPIVFKAKGGGAAQGQQMLGVATVPFGLVAVGFDHPNGRSRPAVAAVWTSTDGETWAPVGNSSLSGQGNREMNDVVVSEDDTLLAAGDGPSPQQGQGQDPEIWTAELK